MVRLVRANAPYYLLVLVIAGGLKAEYSRADADGLRWILGPTADVVSVATGSTFTYVAGEGYLDTGHDVIIAPACAGVNFLVICVCLLGFAHLHRFGGPTEKVEFVALVCAAAYGLTLVVNSARIALAVACSTAYLPSLGLTPEASHRLEGVLVYFTALIATYVVSERVLKRARRKCEPTRRQPSFRFPIAPIFWYLLITIGIPVFRSPERVSQPDFLLHAAVVISAAGAIGALFLCIRYACSRVDSLRIGWYMISPRSPVHNWIR